MLTRRRLPTLLAAAFAPLAFPARAEGLQEAVPPGTGIVVADDANHAKSLLHLSGEQDRLAAKVAYANFTSGPLRLEAIRAGAAQVGAVGDVPPILAQFSGANVVIVAAVRGNGTGYRMVTAPGSDIATVADLRGKRIGINEGTAQQAVALRNLRAVGLTVRDIKPINLGLSEFADALRAGQIDAAVLKQPDRARYLRSAGPKGAREIPSAPGTDPSINYLYASKAALADPAQAAAIRDFVLGWYRAYAWKNAHREAWIQGYYVRDQRLQPDDAAQAALAQGEVSFPTFTDELVRIQQDTVDILQQAGAFAGRTLNARDQFDFRFGALTAGTAG